MSDTATDHHPGSSDEWPPATFAAPSAIDVGVARWPHFKPPVPDAPSCHCGEALTPCPGCRELRCLWCDPVRSDDCLWRL